MFNVKDYLYLKFVRSDFPQILVLSFFGAYDRNLERRLWGLRESEVKISKGITAKVPILMLWQLLMVRFCFFLWSSWKIQIISIGAKLFIMTNKKSLEIQ